MINVLLRACIQWVTILFPTGGKSRVTFVMTSQHDNGI